MKVLSLGYPRTGTMSTAVALSILGFNDVYHMVSVFENPSDCDIWVRALDAKRYGGTRGKFTKRDVSKRINLNLIFIQCFHLVGRASRTLHGCS